MRGVSTRQSVLPPACANAEVTLPPSSRGVTRPSGCSTAGPDAPSRFTFTSQRVRQRCGTVGVAAVAGVAARPPATRPGLGRSGGPARLRRRPRSTGRWAPRAPSGSEGASHATRGPSLRHGQAAGAPGSDATRSRRDRAPCRAWRAWCVHRRERQASPSSAVGRTEQPHRAAVRPPGDVVDPVAGRVEAADLAVRSDANQVRSAVGTQSGAAAGRPACRAAASTTCGPLRRRSSPWRLVASDQISRAPPSGRQTNARRRRSRSVSARDSPPCARSSSRTCFRFGRAPVGRSARNASQRPSGESRGWSARRRRRPPRAVSRPAWRSTSTISGRYDGGPSSGVSTRTHAEGALAVGGQVRVGEEHQVAQVLALERSGDSSATGSALLSRRSRPVRTAYRITPAATEAFSEGFLPGGHATSSSQSSATRRRRPSTFGADHQRDVAVPVDAVGPRVAVRVRAVHPDALVLQVAIRARQVGHLHQRQEARGAGGGLGDHAVSGASGALRSRRRGRRTPRRCG